ncbi:MAG: hypothetical protein IJP79_07330 [Paludibacteraceae bacterium]|nr:hypothetical protein [Paludibacteraceae bacterium]MBQ6963496.1 hypothetical protein [Paludibacteraceae bacterium]MBQ7662490.1 hypothetical protein [Prevotella sp.]MBQ7748286.1 hypothetical protein [Paludibacteraceae bacterium]
MKSYTDVEQSKKLAEILPVESADMGWNVFVDDTKRPLPIDDWNLVKDGSGNVKFYPAWSLAALLDVYPMVVGIDMEMYCCWQNRENLHSRHYDNPVDACVEMVLKLHELKLF